MNAPKQSPTSTTENRRLVARFLRGLSAVALALALLVTNLPVAESLYPVGPSIGDQNLDRVLDAGNGSQGWTVSHAPPSGRADQRWSLESAASVLADLDAPCTRHQTAVFWKDYVAACLEDRPLLRAAVRQGATRIVAVATDFSNHRRWLVPTGSADTGFAVRTTRATASTDPYELLWFVVPADGTNAERLVHFRTGRSLARHGGPGNVTTLASPTAATHWTFLSAGIDASPSGHANFR